MPDYISKSFRYNGKQYNVKAKTEKECYEKIAEKKLMLKRNEVTPKTMTVAQWSKEWLEVYVEPKVKAPGSEKRQGTMTKKSYDHYVSIINQHILPYIGNMKLADVKNSDLQKVLNAQSDMSFSHCKHFVTTLRAMFKQARIARMISFDPSEGLVIPSVKKGKRRAITDEEKEVLLKVAETSPYGLMVKFLLYTGLRSGEMRALKVKNVDIENNLISVKEAVECGTNVVGVPKTEAGKRYVFIPAEIKDELAKHIKDRDPEDFVFTKRKGKGMISAIGLYQNWKSFTYQMDILMGAEHEPHGHIYDPNDLLPDGTPMYPDPKDKTKPRNGHKLAEDFCMYNLRHTFCTDLGKRGVSAEDRKYLMGHEDIRTTLAIYTHPGAETALRAAKVLSNNE